MHVVDLNNNNKDHSNKKRLKIQTDHNKKKPRIQINNKDKLKIQINHEMKNLKDLTVLKNVKIKIQDANSTIYLQDI